MSRPAILAAYRQRIHQNKRQRLSQPELDELITSFIETLTHQTSETAIKAQCQAEIELLEEGYPQTTLATKYLSKYRQAIKTAITQGTLPLTPQTSHQYQHHQRHTGQPTTRTEHWALTHLKYSREIYESLDQQQSRNNRSKQLNLKPVPLTQYLQTLQTLLSAESENKSRTQAIAIAGLTGRRIGEVLARGTFQPTDHPYLLHFEGQQKKERPGYNIITLIPAAEVLTHIEQLRQQPEIQTITQLSGEALKTAINQLDVQINRLCDRHLNQSGIIPPLEGKKTVTVHNLRSLWGAIAAHLFCPDHYHEYAFIQHYLGHVLDSGATGNYFRYQLIDSQGNLLREKGILLNQIGALPLIQPETDPIAHPTLSPSFDLSTHESAPMTQAQPNSSTPAPTPSNVPLTERDLQTLRAEWQQTLNQTITALRADIETQLTKLHQTANPTEITTRIETLEQENLTLRLEHEHAIAQLQTENETLTQKLKQAQDKLDRFRQLLNSNETDSANDANETQAHDPSESEPNPVNPDPAQPIHSSEPPEPSKPRGPQPGKAFQRAEAIVLAIKDWNRLNPSESFAINAGLLETVFRVHRQAVKAFFEAYQNELWDYHQDIGVESPRWHNRGKDPQKLKAFVTQSLER
jgi:hypothetical protein